MNRTDSQVCQMLSAIEVPLYDVGVLSHKGMLPRLDALTPKSVIDCLPLLKYRNARGSHIYLRPFGEHRYTILDDLCQASLEKLVADGFTPCAVTQTSVGNFQAWLKHLGVLPKLLGTFAAQTLARRYGANPSVADWRQFGRLPGFTNCKPKYRRLGGLFPIVWLHSHSGEQYPMAHAFYEEITLLYKAREQEWKVRHLQSPLSPRGGRGSSKPSLERFRTSTRYQDRPALADIAFCIAAYANGMSEERMQRALEEEYLSRDPSPFRRSIYISRTMAKARECANAKSTKIPIAEAFIETATVP